MTPPPTRTLAAWSFSVVLGGLLVSESAGAAPATSPKGQVAQEPRTGAPVAVLAAPATPSPDAPAEMAPAVEPVMNVSQARSALERGMAELAELAARARQSGDMQRVACVQDKQDRAGAVMEVATGDILVVQDSVVDAPTRAFAGEKLAEAAQQMKGLVGQARACQGKEEAAGGKASNDSFVPPTILPQDPTGSLPPAQRGLPPIDPRPPVASPVL
jgi:hypothetical protein